MDFSPQAHPPRLHPLLAYIGRVPGVEVNDTPSKGFGSGEGADGSWWITFTIDIQHALAWNVVQEFAHVLNTLSLNERLPTVFKPTSPPPYLNGGPRDYLRWEIECSEAMSPAAITEWLETRLPRPVDDLTEWQNDDE